MKRFYFVLIFCVTVSGASAEGFDSYGEPDVQKAIRHALGHPAEGCFLTFHSENAFDEGWFRLGAVPGYTRFSATFRNKSCWMIPVIGESLSELPAETQFLLIERGSSGYLMMIPLVDERTRCSLGGKGDGSLELIAETGDTLTRVNEFLGLYLLAGSDPQHMIRQASREIQQALQTFRLREEKSAPWFADHFGWCTWNALSVNLSHDTLLYAAKDFKSKDIPVKYFIVDAGWQSDRKGFLNNFGPHREKFPQGLAPLISRLKSDYGIEKVIMWQALWGTFKGLDFDSFPDLGIPTRALLPPRMIRAHGLEKEEDPDQVATMGNIFYPGVKGRDMVVPDFVPYYESNFDYLRSQGADGVKIDAMTWVESVGNNRGGRVACMKDMMQGVQSAVNVHFNNEMINCSACSNDYLFNALTANVTRSSGDFFPNKPESHGFHVFTNAHTSFWMGEIVLPDWDMFQSGHVSGAFHAAARAISGGPVYTTEEIGAENKEVLDMLMTSEGRIPRCRDVGRVCTESLFTDPASGLGAVKIYNTNLLGGIVGAFNCSYDPEKAVVVKSELKPTDINSLSGDDFVLYRHSTGKLVRIKRSQSCSIKLKQLEFELCTFMPVQKGFAPLGITDKYNPAGMITSYTEAAPGVITLEVMDAGPFLAWSEKEPARVMVNQEETIFKYVKKTGELTLDVTRSGTSRITIFL